MRVSGSLVAALLYCSALAALAAAGPGPGQEVPGRAPQDPASTSWLDHRLKKQGATLNEIWSKVVPFMTVADAGHDLPTGQLLLLGWCGWMAFLCVIAAWVVRAGPQTTEVRGSTVAGAYAEQQVEEWKSKAATLAWGWPSSATAGTVTQPTRLWWTLSAGTPRSGGWRRHPRCRIGLARCAHRSSSRPSRPPTFCGSLGPRGVRSPTTLLPWP